MASYGVADRLADRGRPLRRGLPTLVSVLRLPVAHCPRREAPRPRRRAAARCRPRAGRWHTATRLAAEEVAGVVPVTAVESSGCAATTLIGVPASAASTSERLVALIRIGAG